MTTPVPVLPAATVMLVRDGSDGLEVCLLQRNLKSAWIGGLHLFPGGGVDPADGAESVEASCAGLTDAEASRRLHVTSGGLAFWVAAVREAFEEAGLLLARTADGEPLRLEDDEIVARFADHRRAVDQGTRRLVDICAEEHLRLDLAEMHYVAHWITPPGEARRYDTRFFLAAAPAGQQPIHDDREVISAEWIRPADALAQQGAGTFFMMPPTVACLRSIAETTDVREAVAAAAALDEIQTVAPRLLTDEGGQVTVVRPGDPGYEDAYTGDEIVRGKIA
jgi:8-oxo-dGTP pyrophosphatase MutT (NUDIX family)